MNRGDRGITFPAMSMEQFNDLGRTTLLPCTGVHCFKQHSSMQINIHLNSQCGPNVLIVPGLPRDTIVPCVGQLVPRVWSGWLPGHLPQLGGG